MIGSSSEPNHSPAGAAFIGKKRSRFRKRAFRIRRAGAARTADTATNEELDRLEQHAGRRWLTGVLFVCGALIIGVVAFLRSCWQG